MIFTIRSTFKVLLLQSLFLLMGYQVVAQDTDADGVANATDLDDDNDGISDAQEEFYLLSNFKPACGGASTFNFSGALTLVSGTEKQKGAVYRIANVAANTDALIEIEDRVNVTDITIDDNSSSPNSFRPSNTVNNLAQNSEAYTQYKITFVTAGTTTPVVVGAMYANFADIDGSGQTADVAFVNGHVSYTHLEVTPLTVVNSVYSNEINWTKFTAGQNEVNGSDTLDKTVALTARIVKASSFRLRAGIVSRQPSIGVISRAHRIDFTCILNYATPDTYVIDFDEDGVLNTVDLDSDNDGISDLIEAGGVDADNNGLVDAGNGAVVLPLTDTDSDANSDFIDTDSDGDGISDIIEAFPTAQPVALTGLDDDRDGVDNAFETSTGFGAAFKAPVNSDGADTPDYLDTNSDNDTQNDAIEGWDSDNDGVANIVAAGTDADRDGLDDAFDVNDSAINIGNGQTPESFPNLDKASTPERDWREAFVTKPVANADHLSVNEDSPLLLAVIFNNDVASDEGPSATKPFTITRQPEHGTFSINNNGTPEDLTDDIYTFIPAANYNGADSFIYEICDIDNECDTALVKITITPVNDKPLAINDAGMANPNSPVTVDVAENDTDVDLGTVFTFSVVTKPDGTTADIDPATGILTYKPTTDPTPRQDVISYKVCDNGTPELCDTADVTINVPSVPVPPLPSDDQLTVVEDNSGTVNVTTNDVDPNGNLDITKVTITTNAKNGNATVNATNGVITYIPSADFAGTDSLTYQICDNTDSCASAKVYITVTPVNDAPVATDDLTAADPEVTITFDLGANDTDVDADNVFTFTLLTKPEGTEASINATTGILTFKSSSNTTPRQDLVTYKVCDNGTTPLCDEASVLITIPNLPVPPSPQNDLLVVDEDAQGSVTVIDNDKDVNGNLNKTSVEIFANAKNGTATVNKADGIISYVPKPNYNGKDTVEYRIYDEGGLFANAKVYITVNSVNDAPVAADDAGATNFGKETIINVAANDTDIDAGTTFTFTVTTKPDGATKATFDANGNLSYNPGPSTVKRVDVVKYSVCDNGTPQRCDEADVLITVPFPDTAPVANNDVVETNEDTPLNIDVTSNDTDVNENIDKSTVAITVASKRGTASVNAEGIINYVPNADFNGKDSLDYRVSDLTGRPATARVYITVKPVNDAPRVKNLNITVAEDTEFSGNLITSEDVDIEGSALTASTVITAPANGTFTKENNGAFKYLPRLNYNGPDEIVVTVCDQEGACANKSILVSVTPVNDSPVANDVRAGADPGVATEISLISGVSDPDANTVFTYTRISHPANTTANINAATGLLTYTPVNNATIRVDTVLYEVCDNAASKLCDRGYVLISVPDRSFRAKNDLVTINEDEIATVFVLVNDTNFNKVDTNTLAITKAPAHGTAVLNKADGSIVYTPVLNYFGMDTIQYNICKLEQPAECKTAFVILTIRPVNDLDIVSDSVIAGIGTGAVTGNFLSNNSDPEATGLYASSYMVKGPLYGTFQHTPEGDFVYTPKNDAPSVTDIVIVEVCDRGTPALCKNDTLYFTIRQNMFIADGFTPNNDGSNDYFIVETVIPGNISIQIFNRWGSLVYENGNYNNNWDGKSNQGVTVGESLPEGTYFYEVKFGNGEVKRNYLTLLK